MSCSGCGLDKPIQNKKHNLCPDCVFRKNHGGKSKQEVYSERASQQPKKIYTFKRSSKPIKQQKESEAEIKRQLSALKRDIEIEALQNDMYYCWGCGDTSNVLDKSHILSVKHRKDLELDRANINLYCRRCHIAWESWSIAQMVQLLTFEKDIEYIQVKDPIIYKKILILLEDYVKAAISADKNIEKSRKILRKSLLRPG